MGATALELVGPLVSSRGGAVGVGVVRILLLCWWGRWGVPCLLTWAPR